MFDPYPNPQHPTPQACCSTCPSQRHSNNFQQNHFEMGNSQNLLQARKGGCSGSFAERFMNGGYFDLGYGGGGTRGERHGLKASSWAGGTHSTSSTRRHTFLDDSTNLPLFSELKTIYFISKALLSQHFLQMLFLLLLPSILKQIQRRQKETSDNPDARHSHTQFPYKFRISILSFLVIFLNLMFGGACAFTLARYCALNFGAFIIKDSLMVRLYKSRTVNHFGRLLGVLLVYVVMGSLGDARGGHDVDGSTTAGTPPGSATAETPKLTCSSTDPWQTRQIYFFQLLHLKKSKQIFYFLLFTLIKLPATLVDQYINQSTHPSNTSTKLALQKIAKSQAPELVFYAVFNVMMNLMVVVLVFLDGSTVVGGGGDKTFGVLVALAYFVDVLRFYEKKKVASESEMEGQKVQEDKPRGKSERQNIYCCGH